MCTFYYSGKHCFGNMNMADFLSQIASYPLRQWRDKDRNTGIQVQLYVGICSWRGKCIWNISLLQITLVLFASSYIPASFLLLGMGSHTNFPLTAPFQQDLLHVPENLVCNLPGYWVPACTWQSAGCPFKHGRWRPSTDFHLHFFPLKIAAVIHELLNH